MILTFCSTRYETETKSAKFGILYFVFCLPQGIALYPRHKEWPYKVEKPKKASPCRV